MNEYIDKKQAIDRIASCYCMDCEHSNGILCRACEHQDDMDLIDDMPAVDVQPIRHGRWTWDSNAPYREHGAYKCSNCDCHSDFKENYCYNCGARMDIIYEDDKIRAIKVTG